MTTYTPDNWIIIKFGGHDPHYRVLGGWSGGYLNGSSWRMNSGITGVEETDTHYLFYGSSGSTYKCHKEAYCLRMNNAFVWNSLSEKHGDMVELMPEETDWNNTDWIINDK